MEFITADDYKIYADLKKPDVESSIKAMIKAANALVTQLLGYDDSSIVTDLLNAKPARRKYFLTSPTAAKIISLKINDRLIENPEQYQLYSGGILLLKFTPTEGFMEVTYEQYELNPVPDDLKLATCLLVDYWQKQDYRQNKTIGGETIAFNTTKSGVPEHIRTIIEVHRRL